MKLIKVKCPKNKKLEVEDLGTGAARCPEHCPLKQSSRCFNNTFRYTVVLNPSVVPDIPFVVGASCGGQKNDTVAPSRAPAREVTQPVTAPFSTRVRESASVAPARNTRFEPTPIQDKQPKVIGYNDPFAAPEPAGSVIGYDDPFAAPASEGSNLPTSGFGGTGRETKPKSVKSTLEKYNDTLMSSNSIFAAVKTRNPDEPCFSDGAYEFYERAVPGKYSSGNSMAAMRYIFRHWYVSKVFKEDGKTYQEPFLYLLKLRNFKNKEEELKTIAEDVTLDVNRKFFRLFYTVIYQNQINVFYWNEGDSSLREIAPRFLDKNDFYKKLVSSKNASEFLMSFEPCFDELVYFLQSGAWVESGKEWFKKNIPLAVAEQQGSVSFIDESHGHLSLINLGNVREFAKGLKKPASLEQMMEEYKFLRDFKITVNYKVLPREKPLPLLKATTVEDDGIYEAVGLSENISSQCATAYNYYTTLLKEYIDVFHPEDLLIGDSYFSCRNFYQELVDLITGVCAHLSEEDGKVANYAETKRLYMVKSFFARGVFEYFESRCETVRMSKLKKVFMESERIDLEAYFKFDGIKHWIYSNGQRKTVGAYISEIVKGRDAQDILGRTDKDKVLKAYFDAMVNPADWKISQTQLAELCKEQQAKIDKF